MIRAFSHRERETLDSLRERHGAEPDEGRLKEEEIRHRPRRPRLRLRIRVLIFRIISFLTVLSLLRRGLRIFRIGCRLLIRVLMIICF